MKSSVLVHGYLLLMYMSPIWSQCLLDVCSVRPDVGLLRPYHELPALNMAESGACPVAIGLHFSVDTVTPEWRRRSSCLAESHESASTHILKLLCFY